MKIFFRLLSALFVFTSLAVLSVSAQPSSTPAEGRTVRHFDSIKTRPLLLAAFLREMPKGGDLHNHLSGAIYAESFIKWGAEADACLDTATMSATPCRAGTISMKDVVANPVIYRAVIDAWSMRNYELSGQSGHDHFFDTFGKFGYAGNGRAGDMLAEAVGLAARDNVLYLELMMTPDEGRVAGLGRKIGWNSDFATMRNRLLAEGLRDSLKVAVNGLNQWESRMRQLLNCDGAGGGEGCDIPVRYLYQVGRGLAPEMVFAQILAGFEMAELDPRFVGFNLVMPEDYPVPIRDFTLHMEIINFLRPLYKKAHISLHAGELAPGLVPPDELCCHIRQSIELGHAERIGHGVDVAYEDDPFGLLKLMADRKVMVEICLTSNEVILGITGQHHSLHLYRAHGVPTALATDDEGVSRIDLTHEYVKAVRDHGLSYLDLKGMARTSLEHAFLPGKSIWSDAKNFTLVPECSGNTPGSAKQTPSCKAYLEANEKARLQWELEKKFGEFEGRS
ncbi:MAG: adenosine deaminase [Candidatus Kapaibacterium sp.]